MNDEEAIAYARSAAEDLGCEWTDALLIRRIRIWPWRANYGGSVRGWVRTAAD